MMVSISERGHPFIEDCNPPFVITTKPVSRRKSRWDAAKSTRRAIAGFKMSK